MDAAPLPKRYVMPLLTLDRWSRRSSSDRHHHCQPLGVLRADLHADIGPLIYTSLFFVDAEAHFSPCAGLGV